jgi:prepilin-type N-terminal cleavage/methylation domain-containing protein
MAINKNDSGFTPLENPTDKAEFSSSKISGRNGINVGSSLVTPSAHTVKEKSQTGFTILEVIISLVIVGISMVIFVKLLGNSSMLRAKLNDYDERLDIAISKTEQTFLGLLDNNSTQGDNERVLRGKTSDKGINWRIEEEKDDSFSKHGKDVYIYTVSVDGIEVSSVALK